MTNAEKFKEVFGIEPDREILVLECPCDILNCPYYSDYECHCEKWWDAPYKGEGGTQHEI